jgi:tRNA(Ile)-lysidine synthase
VATVDHGLRPEAPDDVAWVRALSERLGWPFVTERVEVGPTPSLQAAAREVRYEALRRLAARRGAGRVAIGHTLDDQAETVLARLLRGSGLRGLGGIEPRRRDGVVRPLIDCTRADVHAYLSHRGVVARSDPSNSDPRFERARLRASLMPRLEAEDPQIARHLARVADEARSTDRYLRRRADRWLARHPCQGDELRLPRGPLARAPAPVQRAIVALWIERRTGHAPRRAHIRAVQQAAATGRGTVWLSGGYHIVTEGEWVVLAASPERTAAGVRGREKLQD